MALGGAVLTDHPAGQPLGDAQHALQMVHGAAACGLRGFLGQLPQGVLLQLGLGQQRFSPAFSAASSFRRLGPSACPRTARARRSGLRLEVTQAAAEVSRLMYQACALSLPVEARRQGRAKRARPLGVLS
jgi:hypothetical protein